ncbi:hypothetical protein SAMN05444285_10531 [Draconibacterium orientale]|uniref:Uncharacterized protein n=1 Tax=Draconibacterium orientale TaxID=1168034 RepID=A0A1I0B9S7_9BACT|nr:hypothetical protein SAMN05444285_10531 [Draconibacterium orientale]
MNYLLCDDITPLILFKDKLKKYLEAEIKFWRHIRTLINIIIIKNYRFLNREHVDFLF